MVQKYKNIIDFPKNTTKNCYFHAKLTNIVIKRIHRTPVLSKKRNLYFHFSLFIYIVCVCKKYVTNVIV